MPISNLSITFKSKHSQPAGSGTSFLLAAVGDQITAVINYQCDDVHAAVNFYYQLAKNSDSKDTYTYAANVDNSLTQRFVGEIDGELEPGAPLGWYAELPSTEMCLHEALGAGAYRITHRFVINPFPAAEGDIPAEFLSTESIKYVFKIETRNSLNDPNTISAATSETVEKMGNVGFLNERFNGGPAIWKFDTWENEDLNTNDGELSFYLVPSNSSHLASQVYVTAHACLYDFSYNRVLPFEQNYNYATAAGIANGSIYSGLNVQEFSAESQSGKLLVKLKLDLSGFRGTTFNLWMVVGNYPTNEIDSNRNAVYVKQFTTEDTEEPAASDGFSVIQHPLASFRGIAFYPHHLNEIEQTTAAASSVRAAVQDGILARAKFATGHGYRLRRLVVEIKDGSSVLEKREFSVNTSTIKGYKLAPGDEMNLCTFNFSTLELEYAFKIRHEWWKRNLSQDGYQDWAGYQNIRFCVTGYVVDGNNTELAYEYYTAPFQIAGYGGSLSDPDEPIVNIGEIKTFNPDTSEDLGGALRIDGLTLVEAEFRGANSAGLGKSIEKLYGLLFIDSETSGGVNYIRQISSIVGREGDTPFIATTPGIDFAELTNYNRDAPNGDGTFGKIKIRAYVNASKDYLSGKGCIIKTARLNCIDIQEFTYIILSFHFRTGLSWLSFQVSEALPSNEILQIFNNLPISSFSFKVNTVNTWDTAPYLSAPDFQNELRNAVNGTWIYLETNSDAFRDGGLNIKYTRNSQSVANPITWTRQNSFDVDDIIYDVKDSDNDNYVISSLTATNSSSLFIALRNQATSALGNTDFVVATPANITAINNQIAALPANSRYGIHVASVPTTNNNFTFSLAGSYPNNTRKQKLAHVGSHTRANYRQSLTGNSKTYDGAFDYDIIANFNQVDFGQPFTFHATIFVTTFQLCFLFSTRAKKGLIERGFNVTILANRFLLFNLAHQVGSIWSVAQSAIQLKPGHNIITCINAGTGNATDNQIFVNGISGTTIVANTLGGNTIVNTANTAYVGRNNPDLNEGNRFFAGNMRKLQIVNRALTPAEIRDIYLLGEINNTICIDSEFLLDINFNQTGTANLTTRLGTPSYDISAQGGASYTNFI